MLARDLERWRKKVQYKGFNWHRKVTEIIGEEINGGEIERRGAFVKWRPAIAN